MPFLSTQRYERVVKRKNYEIILGIAIVLFVLSVFLMIRLVGGSTTDTTLRDTLMEQAEQEDKLAREYASRISRIGGTGTVHVLAMTRQHLHGLEQINKLANQLLQKKEIVPSEAINLAFDALDECETLVLSAKTIDAPMGVLWEQLDIISQALAEQQPQ